MDSSVQDKSEETQEKEDAPKAESNQQAGISEPQSESTDTTEPLKTGQQPEVVVDQNPQADCNKSDDTPKDSSDVNVEEKYNVDSGIQKDDNPKISDENPKVPNDGNPSEGPEENPEKSSEVPGEKTLQNPMDPNPEVPSQNQNPDAPVDQPIEQTDAPGNKDIYVPENSSTDDLEGNTPREPKVPKLTEPSTTPDEPKNAIPSEMKQKENSTEPEATSDEENKGADQDLNPSGYAPPTEPEESKSLDKGETDDPQQSNTEPGVEDQVDMSPQVNQNRDEDVNPVNTYKEEEPKPWELSDDEHPSSPETTNPDQVKAVGYGKISNPKRNIFVMIVLITSINDTIYIYSAYSFTNFSTLLTGRKRGGESFCGRRGCNVTGNHKYCIYRGTYIYKTFLVP